MNKILQSEHLKQKHTFQKKLIYLAPLVSIAIAFVLMGGYYIQKSAYNWWYTLILPGSFTMICSFIISNDRKRKFNGLFSVIVDKQKNVVENLYNAMNDMFINDKKRESFVKEACTEVTMREEYDKINYYNEFSKRIKNDVKR